MPIDQLQLRAIRENSEPIMGSGAEYGPLTDLIRDSRFVLIGEASHGTHEFYHTRASLTRRLIEEKGDGSTWRAKCGSACTRKVRQRRGLDWVHELYRQRNRRLQLGRPGRTKTRTASAQRQLRSIASCNAYAELSDGAARKQISCTHPEPGAFGAGDWGCVPAQIRAGQSLLWSALGRSI